jgi:drug/metabolite transporter (DMT)-like permease
MRDPAVAHRKSVILLVLAAILWSTSGVFIKLLDWPPMAILGGRSLFAALLFLAYLRPRSLRWTRLEVLGATSYVVAQLAFITATKLTTAANAIFLQYAAPIYIVLLGWWLLGERPKRADLIALPVIFCGLTLFLGDDLTASGLAGNIFAVASGVAMAAWFLAMRGQKDGAPANTILLGNILGALVGLPFFLRADLTPQSLTVIVYLGVFQLGMAGLLYSIAIKHVPVLESTIILMLEPILNPIWVFLALGETPGTLALIGAALVLGATLWRASYAGRVLAPAAARQ